MPRRALASQYFSNVTEHPEIWDSVWNARSIGRIAVSLLPSAERVSRIRESIEFELDESVHRPAMWTPEWDQAILDQLYDIAARMELGSDYCAALSVPRFVHGQSQGIADVFGARVEAQFDGNYFTHPLPPNPDYIEAVEARPLESSIYWGAVEWTRYANQATGGALLITNPVMTGPIDTVNYLLGSTVLMEWLYTEPDTVHGLLAKVIDTIVVMVRALRSAGGAGHPLHFGCVRGGFDMCSEVRSLLSRPIYEGFEAPYLRRIGEACGPYAIHSCGSWERTVPSALDDPNLRAMNSQIKENDLQALCDDASGRIMLSIGPSVNVHTRFTWSDMESFYRHILETVPDYQPFEVSVSEADLPLWQALHRQIRGGEFAFEGLV